MFVDRGVLLYIGVARRHVGLGLVVVVVRHEVLDRVFREEIAEFRIKLGRERFVRRQHQRRALQLRDHIRDREGLTRAGDAEQRLVSVAPLEASDERTNGLRLIAGGFKRADEFERLVHGYVFHGASGILAHFATAFAETILSDIRLSSRVRRIKPSPTLAVTARAAAMKAQGRDVVGLGAGEPDFDTPEHIKEAAIRAIRDGFTKYTAVAGTPSLKKAIVAKFKRENGLDYTPDQILVSVGGKQSFYNLAMALLDAGDEVIIPAPYWVSYPDMVLLADATPVIVAAGIEQQYKITAAQLKAAITPKTRLVVINSPSNPTGMVYSRAELVALCEA